MPPGRAVQRQAPPYTYVTTPHFLSAFGLETLRDLPDIEALEDSGLLSRHVAQEELAAPKGEDAEADEESSFASDGYWLQSLCHRRTEIFCQTLCCCPSLGEREPRSFLRKDMISKAAHDSELPADAAAGMVHKQAVEDFRSFARRRRDHLDRERRLWSIQ